MAISQAAKEAFKTADITPQEIDVAEIYAPFSPHELMVPEEIGWFSKGGMITAIENGDTEVGGKIPLNTDGGLLSRGHPWAVTPFYEGGCLILKNPNFSFKFGGFQPPFCSFTPSYMVKLSR